MTTAQRRRSLITPREHGAWGILLIPLVTGASVGLLKGGDAKRLAPFSIAAFALFCLRTPVESWIGTGPLRARTASELGFVRGFTGLLALASIAALVWLFWGGRNRALFWMGAAAATAFFLQAVLKVQWKTARTAAQVVGAAGLTLTAPAAYYVVTARVDVAAWWLWAANLLFAGNQIQFVQVRIRAANSSDREERLTLGLGFLIGQTILMALLVAGCVLRLLPPYTAVAFVPVLYRGFAWFVRNPRPLAIHSLGRSELLYACMFGLLLILGMQAS